MNKLVACIAVVALTVVLAGCTSGTASSSASASGASSEQAASEVAASESSAASVGTETSSSVSSAASPENEAVAGGWEMGEGLVVDALTTEQKELFESAVEDLDGVAYEPVAVIGEQVVAGMNYAYLCKATATTPNAEPAWNVVVIYKDLDGKASFTCANELDPANVAVTGDDPGEPAAGAWSAPDMSEVAELPEAAESAFDEAMGEYVGVDPMSPVALLGTQVVAGTNYKVMFIGMPVVPDAANVLYVATVYQDPSKTSTISDMGVVDLVRYVTEAAE